MKRSGSYNRRSFMARIVGGVAAAGGAVLVARAAGAQPRAAGEDGERYVVDRDPSDPARRPAPAPPPRPVDTDSGASADATGRGGGKPARAGASRPSEAFVICPGNPRCPPN